MVGQVILVFYVALVVLLLLLNYAGKRFATDYRQVTLEQDFITLGPSEHLVFDKLDSYWINLIELLLIM